jgi:YHS domain-containing protein/putative intracellular protease/amidase
MNRRELIGLGASIVSAAALNSHATYARRIAEDIPLGDVTARPDPLPAPRQWPIQVAFVVADGVSIPDLFGPWSVFQSVRLPSPTAAPFVPFTVADGLGPVTASGGLQIVPNYTCETAPAPRLLVVPGSREPSNVMLRWIREMSRQTDLTLSVCTGAFTLARAQLLRGRCATTHHNAYADLAMQFPEVVVRRGMRFVESGNIATAGGQGCGVDLALHVVERYLGRGVASETALFMEYQGNGWTDMRSNLAYSRHNVSSVAHPLCPVCEMSVDVKTASRSNYRGQTYYFCMPGHKSAFDAAPERYLEAL